MWRVETKFKQMWKFLSVIWIKFTWVSFIKCRISKCHCHQSYLIYTTGPLMTFYLGKWLKLFSVSRKFERDSVLVELMWFGAHKNSSNLQLCCFRKPWKQYKQNKSRKNVMKLTQKHDENRDRCSSFKYLNILKMVAQNIFDRG